MSATARHRREGSSHISWRHFLLALLETKNCAANSLLQASAISVGALGRELSQLRGHEPKGQAGAESPYTAPAEAAWLRAQESAKSQELPLLGSADLLLALRPLCPSEYEELLNRHGWRETTLEGPAPADSAPTETAKKGNLAATWALFTLGLLVGTLPIYLDWGLATQGALGGAAVAMIAFSFSRYRPSVVAQPPAGQPCQGCGYRSEIAQHFRRAGRGSLCLKCLERAPAQAWQMWTQFSLALLFLGLFLVANLDFGWGLVNLGLWLLLPNFLVNLHELGHQLAARLVGIPVPAVIVGQGPILASLRVFGTSWSWHKHIVGGITLLLPRDQVNWRQFLAVLGGPTTNLALAGAPFFLSSRALFPEDGLVLAFEFWEVWILANLWMAVNSLLPRETWLGPSDGKQVLEMLRGQRFSGEALPVLVQFMAVHHLLQAKRLQQAQSLLESGLTIHPNSLSLLLQRSVLHCELDDYRAARADAVEALARADGAPHYQASAWNTAAWADLFLGPEFLEEADDFSQRALAVESDNGNYLGTRGTVLLRAGRYQEASDHLKLSLQRDTCTSSLAVNYSYLAQAEWACGRPASSQLGPAFRSRVQILAGSGSRPIPIP